MKSKILCVVVVLAFAFGACNKDVPDQIFDEGTVVNGAKRFLWVDNGNPAAGYYYNYGQVLPQDFAHFESGGTQFNNGCEFEVPGTDGSILLCREPGNNGNGWVKIKFLPEAIKFVEKDMDCDYAIGVRFKGSLNAVYTFNIKNCIAFGDWIELDVADMGPITQIRFGGAAAFFCNPKPATVTIRFFRSIVVDGESVVDTDPFYVITDFPKGGEFTHCLVWEAGANVYQSHGLPYHGPPVRMAEIACEYDMWSGREQAVFYGYLECFEKGIVPNHKWMAAGQDFITGNSNIDYEVVGVGFVIDEDLDLVCEFEPCDSTNPCEECYAANQNCITDNDGNFLRCEDKGFTVEFYEGATPLCTPFFKEGEVVTDACAHEEGKLSISDCEELSWLNETGEAVDLTSITEDITLYANIITIQYFVTFEAPVSVVVPVGCGGLVDPQAPDPCKVYVWVLDPDSPVPFNFNAPITENITLYPIISDKCPEGTVCKNGICEDIYYIVTYKETGAYDVAVQVKHGEKTANRSLTNPLDYCKSFYWAKDGVQFDFDTQITENIELNAVLAADPFSLIYSLDPKLSDNCFPSSAGQAAYSAYSAAYDALDAKLKGNLTKCDEDDVLGLIDAFEKAETALKLTAMSSFTISGSELDVTKYKGAKDIIKKAALFSVNVEICGRESTLGEKLFVGWNNQDGESPSYLLAYDKNENPHTIYADFAGSNVGSKGTLQYIGPGFPDQNNGKNIVHNGEYYSFPAGAFN